jgi:hypothetical protein
VSSWPPIDHRDQTYAAKKPKGLGLGFSFSFFGYLGLANLLQISSKIIENILKKF